MQDSSIDLSIVFIWRLRSVIMLSRRRVLTSFTPLYSPPQSTQIFSIDSDADGNQFLYVVMFPFQTVLENLEQSRVAV